MSAHVPAPAADAAPTGRTPAVVFWLVAATFTVILNETIMINAIPRLAEDFGVSVQRRAVALDGVPAHDGLGHPGDRLVPAAGHHARRVHRRDDDVPRSAPRWRWWRRRSGCCSWRG